MIETINPPPVDKSRQRIQTMFASIAGNYDRMNHLLSLQVDRYWRWWTVRQVPPEGTSPILDVCTGTGDLALAYWRHAKGSVPIIATDFCREMLDVGQRKQRSAGMEHNLTFLEADTTQLPFPEDHFQIVTVAFGLRNVVDTNLGLQEMKRVCQPGGRVAILEFSLPESAILRSLYGWYFRTILPRIGQFLAKNDKSAYVYLPESVGQFPYGTAMVKLLERQGFEQVRRHPLTLGIATLYVATKPLDRPSAGNRSSDLSVQGGTDA